MNIALFLPNWIGDVVMATPAVRALRRHFAQAHITAVCRPYVTDVLAGSPWFDDVVHLDTRGAWTQQWPAVAWRLRRARIDLAVLFPNSFRTGLVAWLGGCRGRIGFRRYGRGPLLTQCLEPVRDEAGRLKPSPIIDDYNLLAQRAGCPWPGYRLELFTTPANEEAATNTLHKLGIAAGDEYVCLNPGAAFGAAKHWPTPSFARLARDLAKPGRRVLVLCGPGERELARQIEREADDAAVVSLAAAPLSLGLTKALIRRSALLVTTDSGPRHFAAAFDRPVVTLFGPTHIAWTETYHPRAVHLQKKVDCGPCQRRVCPLDHRCMVRLTPDEVFTAAEGLLH
jgi:heptosyltransferase II